MQLVLKNGQVVATHLDGQDIFSKYPGCNIVNWHGTCTIDFLGDNPDPRSDEEKALDYQNQRRAAYPPVVDQLDLIYHDQMDGTSKWRDLLTQIKQEYQPAPADAEVCRQQAAKLASLARMQQGFDTGLGFILRVGETDQHTLASYKTMLDTAILGGIKTTESEVILTDINGQAHSITVGQFYAMILPYGGYCEFLFQQHQTTLAQILAAKTVEDVQAIPDPENR